MLKTQLCILMALAPATLISSSLYANEQSETKGFIADAEGSVLFRTGYLSRDKKGGNADTRSVGQSAIFDLNSGFTQGPVGIAVGAVGDGTVKLGENKHAGNQMLAKDGNGDAYDHFARGGANVKLRVSNTTVTYGTQLMDLPVLASNTVRLVPEYFTGVLAQSNEIDKLELTAGKFTKNQMSDQISTDGNHLDRAVVWGAKYNFTDKLNASYYGIDVKDKLERHFTNVNYSKALPNDANLTLDFSGYHTDWEEDAITDSHATTDMSNRQNSIWAVSANYSKDVHSILLAYQDNAGNTGYDYAYNADGFQSIYLPNSYLSDFIGNDEKSLQLQYVYNFKNHGVPGLTWVSAFVYGWDIDVSERSNPAQVVDQAEEHEFFNQVKYTVQTGPLKDASFRLRHSYLRMSDTYNNYNKYNSNGIGSTNEWRMWLDIPVKLF